MEEKTRFKWDGPVMYRSDSVNMDLKDIRPSMAQGLETSFRRDAEQGGAIIVHKPGDGAYLRLSPALFRFLLMLDGQHRWGDLVSKAESNGLALPISVLRGFLASSYSSGIVSVRSEKEASVLDTLGRTSSTNWVARKGEPKRTRRHFGISGNNAGALVEYIYGYLGKHLLSKYTLAIMAIISFLGFVSFAASLFGNAYGLPYYLRNLNGASLVLVTVGLLASVIAHEMGHAVVCKYFGRRVNGLGIASDFACPGFYVDVSDSAMLPKKKRITVGIAGVAANLVTGGGLALVAEWSTAESWHVAGTIGATINYIAVLVNLLPIPPLDGYRVISDLVNRPTLRDDALRALFMLRHRRVIQHKNLRPPGYHLIAYGLSYLAAGPALLLIISTSIYVVVVQMTVQQHGRGLLCLSLASLTLLALYSVCNLKRIAESARCQRSIVLRRIARTDGNRAGNE